MAPKLASKVICDVAVLCVSTIKDICQPVVSIEDTAVVSKFPSNLAKWPPGT